jgi:hypothetical protein
MKVKLNLVMYSLLVLSVLFGCQNEELNVESIEETNSEVKTTDERLKMRGQQNEVNINHTYNYYGEQFKVSYTYNQKEDQVLKTEGDIEMAEKIFGNNGEEPKSLFFNNPKEGSTDIEVNVFDNQEDLKLYAFKLTGKIPGSEEKPLNTMAKGNCTSQDYWGTGKFYFYKHINYNTSMSGMNRVGRYYYKDHWVGSSYNDQLSSLIVTKPSYKKAIVYLYQHSCFGGKIIGFYQPTGSTGFGITNLTWYTMSGWWWWKKSWNDQVSSTSGWAW